MGSGRPANAEAAPANAAHKKISLATLKANKFYDRASATIDACDENWVHIAEHRDFWRECVVKAAKFHYNYRDPGEQVEYNTRPATPEKISVEQQRANDWDQWLLTEQPLTDEATRKPTRKTKLRKRRMLSGKTIPSRNGSRENKNSTIHHRPTRT